MPANVIVAKADLEDGHYPLTSADALLLRRASARRRLEFAAGRACARMICSMLGRHNATLGISATGAPVWPSGLVGTITHSEKMALCAVAFSKDYANIGVDAEIIGHIEAEIFDFLFSEREIEFLSSVPFPQQAMIRTALFCAKEAFFKSKTALQHSFNNMYEIEIDLDIPSQTFRLSGSENVEDIGFFVFYKIHCVAFYISGNNTAIRSQSLRSSRGSD